MSWSAVHSQLAERCKFAAVGVICIGKELVKGYASCVEGRG